MASGFLLILIHFRLFTNVLPLFILSGSQGFISRNLTISGIVQRRTLLVNVLREGGGNE